MRFARNIDAVFGTAAGKRARQLLGHLSISGMAWLAGVLAGLPLVVLLGLHGQRQWQLIEAAQVAAEGSQVIGHVLQAQAALLQATDLRQRVQAGEAVSAGERAAAQQALQAAVRRLEADAVATGDHAALRGWALQARRLVDQLSAAGRNGELRPAVRDALTQLPALAAELSGLLKHRVGHDTNLAHARAHDLGPWLLALSDLRGRGAAALGGGEPDLTDRAQMLVRADMLARRLVEVQGTVEGLTRAGIPLLAQWQPALAASQRLEALTDEVFSSAGNRFAAGAFAAEATAAASAVLALDGELARLLQAELDRTVQRARWSLGLAVAGCLLSMAVLVLVLRTYTRGLRHVGGVLQRSLAAVAAGDLSRNVPLRGQDALGMVAREVEHMSARMSSLVAEVRSSAVRISQAGQTVAVDGQALAHRTELQSQSLSQSVAVADRLAASVAAHADSAQTLNTLTERLREQLEAGSVVVDQTEQSILSLQGSTQRVAEINQMIDDIAFQTNLLALNASVEAARAGEAGRGFSVVAAEVRQLAQRCANAAGEVRGLIDQTTMQVDEATGQIQQTTALLAQVGGGVQEVARRLNALASASVEQSTGLAEVRESIAALDGITRENSEAVMRSTVAGHGLAEQAEALQRAVSSMRLRQGTADEAQALVLRALAHAEALGLEAAAADFNQGADGWLDRDLYLFALDAHNRYLVAAGRPDWLGLSTFDLPGVTHAQAEGFLREASRAVEAGGGWVEYQGVDPETKAPVAKTAYIAPFGDGGLIGCGVYRRDAQSAPVLPALPEGALPVAAAEAATAPAAA